MSQARPPFCTSLSLTAIDAAALSAGGPNGELMSMTFYSGFRSFPGSAGGVIRGKRDFECWGWKRWLETVQSALRPPLEPDQVGIRAAGPQSECNQGHSLQRLHLWDLKQRRQTSQICRTGALMPVLAPSVCVQATQGACGLLTGCLHTGVGKGLWCRA